VPLPCLWWTQVSARDAGPLACACGAWYERRVTFDERRRIEKALHDGVQQDLIALCVRLQLARTLVDADPRAAAAELEELRREAHAALDRARALADDVYPSLLDGRGLSEALRALGARVDDEGVGRYPPDVEAAAYFFCKDSAGGSNVVLRDEDGALRVDVDGVGATFAVG
jgi:Histidine kinase